MVTETLQPVQQQFVNVLECQVNSARKYNLLNSMSTPAKSMKVMTFLNLWNVMQVTTTTTPEQKLLVNLTCCLIIKAA